MQRSYCFSDQTIGFTFQKFNKYIPQLNYKIIARFSSNACLNNTFKFLLIKSKKVNNQINKFFQSKYNTKCNWLINFMWFSDFVNS